MPVSVIVGSIGDGDTFGEVLGAYPHITVEDIRAALKFAAEAVSDSDFIPLSRNNKP